MKRLTFFILLLLSIEIAAGIGYAEYGDIILGKKMESMQKAGVKPVVFPHWFHIIRFKCKVCHEDIFILQRGANDMDMNKILNGEYCGKCHNGIVAWETLYCDRCHFWDGPIPPYNGTKPPLAGAPASK